MGSGRVGRSVTVTRRTPEQASNAIHQAFGFRLGWENHDVIVDSYAVALGGVDFVAAMERDPTTKVQTLLLSRSIAWAAANKLVWEEHERDTNDRQIFTHGDFRENSPDIEGDSATNWENQLVDIYYRLFSRPPSSDEIESIRSAFLTIKTDNGNADYPPIAWIGVIYSLLSTEEFWHT